MVGCHIRICSEGLQKVVALGSGGDVDFGVDGNPWLAMVEYDGCG